MANVLQAGGAQGEGRRLRDRVTLLVPSQRVSPAI